MEVFLIELDLNGTSEDLMKHIKFTDDEVMAVKLEHYKSVEQKLLRKDPAYVPSAILKEDGSKAPYYKLFDELEKRYPQ